MDMRKSLGAAALSLACALAAPGLAAAAANPGLAALAIAPPVELGALDRLFDGARPDAYGGAAAAIGGPRLPEARRLLADGARVDRNDPLVLKYAQKNRLNPRLLKAVIAAESEFTAGASSRKGAVGLMQVMAETARDMGGHPAGLADPEQNIRAGAAYLGHLFRLVCRRYKVAARSFARAPQWLLRRVLAAYNAGPRVLGRATVSLETEQYLRKVLRLLASPVSALRRHAPARTRALLAAARRR